MDLLTAQQIKQRCNKDSLAREKVEVPEWGGTVLVWEIPAGELDKFEESRLLQKRGKVKLSLADTRARLCVLAIRDPEGIRLFTDADVSWMSRDAGGRALDRVYEVAERLNGRKNQDLEDVAKNSDAGPGDSSPTS